MTIQTMWITFYLKDLASSNVFEKEKESIRIYPLFFNTNGQIIFKIGFLILLFLSCSDISNQKSFTSELKTYTCEYDFNFTKEEIKIPFDFTYTYEEVENFYGWDKYIYFLNQNENTIYIYDIDKNNLFKKIVPAIPVTSIYIYDSSHVFLLGEKFVVQTDWNLSNNKIYQINPDSITEYSIGKFSAYFPLSYDPEKNALYLQRSHWVFSYKQDKSIYYSVESELNLTTGKTDSLPVCYPDIFNRYDFGYMNNVSRSTNDSLNVYSFETDPNIYIYNRYTKTLSVTGGKSMHQNKKITGYNYKDKTINEQDYFYMMIQLASYPVIHFDPYRNLYYRIYQQDQSLYNKQDKLNSILMKKTWLQIYNANFCLLQEYLLPYHNYHHLIVLKKGLAISRMTTKNKGYDKKNIEFDLYIPSNNGL